MLSARRIGSAWPLARTRTAWSRGAAPASMRRPISAAIQSASSEPVAKTSSRTGGGAAADALRPEALDDPGPHLESVRVVEPDQPVGRVEDRRERAVVAPQDDRPRPEVALAEVEDVVDRGAAERVDRLVVVADDRHVPVALGERGDQLGLGAVGVLELVDQDVPEPAGDRAAGRRRRPHEPERERDLVAEVDAAVGRQQRLVGARRRAPARPAGGLPRRRAAASRPVRRAIRRGGRLGHSAPPRPPRGPRAPGSPPARCPRPCSG